MRALQRPALPQSQVASIHFSKGEVEDSQLHPRLQIWGLQTEVMFGSTGKGLASCNSATDSLFFA